MKTIKIQRLLYFRASNTKCCSDVLIEGALEPRTTVRECQRDKKNVRTYAVIKCEGTCCDTWHAPAAIATAGLRFQWQRHLEGFEGMDTMRDRIKWWKKKENIIAMYIRISCKDRRRSNNLQKNLTLGKSPRNAREIP